MEPELTLERIWELGLIAVVRAHSARDAVEVSEALVKGGVSCVEIAFSTPDAHLVLRDLGKRYGNDVLLGAGTVLTREQADLSFEAGARFLASPGCDPELVSTMLDTWLLSLPGILTPSEVMLARRLGARAVKLFPAPGLTDG